MKDPNGIILEDATAIKQAAVTYFKSQLQAEEPQENSLLQVLPNLVSEDMNKALISLPTLAEVKERVELLMVRVQQVLLALQGNSLLLGYYWRGSRSSCFGVFCRFYHASLLDKHTSGHYT